MPGPTIWRYVLRNIQYEGWAIVVMDSSGYFSAVSDFGNYAYKWSAFSGDFRKFLLGLDSCYLLGKISERSYFDEAEVTRHIKEAILRYRKTGSLTRERAREEWDMVDDIQDETTFYNWCLETSLSDPSEYGHRDFPSDAQGFAHRVWPRLCDLWRAELDAVLVSPQT